MVISQGTLVLGPERSGTSLIAGVLSDLGLRVGGGDRKDQFNEGGYWEDAGAVDVNRTILARIGARPRWVPPLSFDWTTLKSVQRLAAQANDVISRLDSGPPWGCKDPRFSVTLPFWKPLFSVAPKYIICFRNPLSVAKSLLAKDGLTIRAGVVHWYVQMSHAIANTSECDRLLVRYEDFFSQGSVLAIERITSFLGTVRDRVDISFPSKDLRHHVTTNEELSASTALSTRARQLFSDLTAVCDGSSSLDAVTASILSEPTSGSAEGWIRLILGSAVNRLAGPVYEKIALRRSLTHGAI
jgi:hypothetical protein